MTATDQRSMPPQDIPAEQAVLGAMLLNSGAAVAEVAAALRGADFYRPAHQTIYEAILRLRSRGEPADPITVSAELLRTGQIGRVGGAPYVHTLMASVPTVANAGYYAAIVAEKAERRRIAESGVRLEQLAHTSTAPIEEIRGRAAAALAGILDGPAGPTPPDAGLPELVRLDQLLAEPDVDPVYLVDKVWPTGGRVMLNAQFKAGKSTMVANLVRALADGVPFLDCYPVQPLSGTVVVLDDELDRRTLRRWYRDHDIKNTDRVHVVLLRGQVAALNLTDPATVAAWAERLRAVGAAVVVLDCLSAVLAAFDLNENDTGEVRRFLGGFDALLLQSGADAGAVVHHAGHNAERGRGASGLRDWPDAEWNLVRERADDPRDDDPAAPRYFKAYGRDVDEPEQRLNFDPLTRRLSIGGQSRRQEKADRHVPAVHRIVAGQPGLSGRQVIAALMAEGVPERAAKEAPKRAVAAGAVFTQDGPRGALLHYPVPGWGQVGTSEDDPTVRSTGDVGTVGYRGPHCPHPLQPTQGQLSEDTPDGVLTHPEETGRLVPSRDGADTPGRRCAVCGFPLDPALGEVRTHPGCGAA